MAHLAASRLPLACLAFICYVIGSALAQENDRNLLNFEVSLPDAGRRVEFVCDLGSGYVEASNSINIDLSELNLLEEVVVSDHNTKGFGEFVCWREKLDFTIPSEIFENLGSQIQGFFTHRLRSLLANEGETSPGPTGPIIGTEKTSKDDKIDPESGKDTLAKNTTDTAPNVGKAPVVEDKSYPPPPPKENGSSPPPPPTEEKEKEAPPPPKQEKEKEGQEPVDPGNQSAQHHNTDDSKYNVCEEGKSLFTRLQTSGDGTQTLTLSLRNDGEGVLDVQIKTPIGLLADPSRVNLRKGEPAVKVNIAVVDRALLANEENILISSSEGECIVPINLDALGNSDTESYFDRFSLPKMPAVVTPEVRIGVFFFILSIIGGLVIWRTWAKWRRRDGTGAGHSYQELEMSLPSNVDNSTSAYGPEKDAKSGSGDEEGWDEVWDDWEDTEAARSSSRLIPSLSAKGLAARRTNKDGWENSWDD